MSACVIELSKSVLWMRVRARYLEMQRRSLWWVRVLAGDEGRGTPGQR